MRFWRSIKLYAALAFLLTVTALPADAKSPAVVVLRVKGAVSPVMASYINRGITAAESVSATAVVIQLDTPGGLDSSMRDIVQRINASRVPVVVYVSPAGGRAASAGVFITMAAHVAAMAPNTAIGAAHPVSGDGADIQGAMADKVLNDAVAYIRGIATLRNRNADWAERAVRESVSVPAADAADQRIVDFVATDLNDLVSKLNGRTVTLTSGPVSLSTTGVPISPVDMNFIEEFLFAISDPNIAYLLMSLAMLAIFLELSNPGAILPGIVGGVGLLVALFGLGMLPVNIAGLLLIFLGFGLLVAEVWITSHGMLGVGGLISLTIGSLILFTGNNPDLQVSRWLIAVVVGGMGLFLLAFVGAVISLRRNRSTVTPEQEVVGSRGVARTAIAPEGTAFVNNELWSARTLGEPISAGEYVRVLTADGLTLVVEPVAALLPDRPPVHDASPAASESPS